MFYSCYSLQIDSLTDAIQQSALAFYRNRTMKKNYLIIEVFGSIIIFMQNHLMRACRKRKFVWPKRNEKMKKTNTGYRSHFCLHNSTSIPIIFVRTRSTACDAYSSVPLIQNNKFILFIEARKFLYKYLSTQKLHSKVQITVPMRWMAQ